MQKKYVLEFDANTEKVESKVEGLNDQIDGVKDSTSSAIDKVDELSGGLVSSFKNGVQGAKNLIGGMRTLKGAIAATGVGALVVALGSLVVWFKNSEKGAKLFSAIGYTLDGLMVTLSKKIEQLIESDLVKFFEDPQQAIMDMGTSLQTYVIENAQKVVKGLGLMGKAIKSLFQGDFTGAMDAAKEGAGNLLDGITNLNPATAIMRRQNELLVDVVKEVGNEFERASDKAYRLAGAEQALAHATARYTVESAKLQTEIDKEQKIIDDTTRSFEERTEALDRQSELSLKLAESIAEQARLEESVISQRLALTANYEERLQLEQELADAQAGRIEKEAQVAIVELENAQKRREINQEQIQAELDRASAVKEIRDAINEQTLSAQELEINATKDKYAQLIELAKQFGVDTAELEETQRMELQAINDRYDAEAEAKQKEQDAKELEARKQLNELRVSSAIGVGNAIAQVAEAFAGDNEARAKRAFNISKAVGIAEALVNTYQGVTSALTDKLTPTPIRIAQAVAAGAFGLAQVAKIKATQFQSSGGGSIPSGSASSGGQSQPSTPQVDFSFLQQGANQTSVQAYVLESNVTNSQQANQLIQDQATL